MAALTPDASGLRLTVLHVVASINPGTGGPARSVPGLAGALARRGAIIDVASLDYREFGPPAVIPGTGSILADPRWLGRRLRGWSPRLSAAIRDAARRADVVHQHGIWMAPGIYARRAAVHARIPLVISPRGMLDAWSLGRSRVRKGIAYVAYERRNMASASLFHATSRMEAEAVRRFGLAQPIAIVPNGVDLPELATVPERRVLEERFPALRKCRWLLFMGRLDPKKGLDLLTEAWRRACSAFPEWHLIIAGPDLEGYGAEIRGRVAGRPELAGRVTFTGMLAGDQKNAALAHSELFVLPTRSENFGIAIAEALAAGTPVVTTTAAPWSELESRACGWWIAPEADSLFEVLATALRMDEPELAARGLVGRRWMAAEFSWDSAAARMIDVYHWLRQGGPAPACVVET